jgi:hypothetical protein
MGFDYQVASSQEMFNNGNWTTRILTETRIRWEPRTGTVDREYQNITIPALEEHDKLVESLGKFNLKKASPYAPDQLDQASIRVPSLPPDGAWPIARSAFDRLVAKDCQIASDAQHVDEFIIKAEYLNLKWTQLLLPVYSTVYHDDNGDVYPIMIHGQNGTIFGVKHASIKKARNWSISLIGVTLISFMIGLVFVAATTLLPILAIISLMFFTFSFIFGIIAPIPAIWAWNFNRSKE